MFSSLAHLRKPVGVSLTLHMGVCGVGDKCPGWAHLGASRFDLGQPFIRSPPYAAVLIWESLSA